MPYRTNKTKVLLLSLVLLGLSARSFAQKPLSIEKTLSTSYIMYEPEMQISELPKHINKEVYLGQTIWGTKMLGDSVKVLYMGGVFPNHKLSVFLKGKEVINCLSNFTNGDKIYFSGKIFLKDGILIILISNVGQVGRRVMI